MRNALAILAVLLAQSLAPHALAQSDIGAAPGLPPPGRSGPAGVQTGTIARLDLATMNFVCRSGRAARQYWITRATRFAAGRPNASFFDLAPGQRVQVLFHPAGGLDVADQVVVLK
ncbi:MAG TPA: hypothetical protein VMF67_13940 [Rhizomicrobium sp.]|nr:hypothetical protein [Rhizomicrobium sp.]